ncbi:MAG: hypothetical protein AB1646_11740 [Thermodesulfobacteriota bacterium]
MNQNGFREDEIVTRRLNGQTRVFPVVGGRLRLAHEENDNLSLQTELVSWDGQYAVFRCTAKTIKGEFAGYGTANNQRDSRLSESLIELAETRSIARALRFAGYGLEYTGAEEVSHVPHGETERGRVGDNGNGNAKGFTGCQNGRATQAQCRALHALTKRAQYAAEDVERLLTPLQVTRFEDLERESASELITHLQTETGRQASAHA